jgi:hypothetical protein
VLGLGGADFRFELSREACAMAQKWLDLANDEFGSHELDAWNKTFYYRAIQTKIGQELRMLYQPPPELPDRIFCASDAASRQ